MAAKLLKWDAIDAQVFTGSDLDAELIEIDENLQRNELTCAERAEHLARRRAIYEAQHPETKHGGDRSKSQNPRLESFAADTAAKTGRGHGAMACLGGGERWRITLRHGGFYAGRAKCPRCGAEMRRNPTEL